MGKRIDPYEANQRVNIALVRKDISEILGSSQNKDNMLESAKDLVERIDHIPGPEFFSDKAKLIREMHESGRTYTEDFLKEVYNLGDVLGADIPETLTEGGSY